MLLEAGGLQLPPRLNLQQVLQAFRQHCGNAPVRVRVLRRLAGHGRKRNGTVAQPGRGVLFALVVPLALKVLVWNFRLAERDAGYANKAPLHCLVLDSKAGP